MWFSKISITVMAVGKQSTFCKQTKLYTQKIKNEHKRDAKAARSRLVLIKSRAIKDRKISRKKMKSQIKRCNVPGLQAAS